MYSPSGGFEMINLTSLNAIGFEMDDMRTFLDQALRDLQPIKVILEKCSKISKGGLLPGSLKGRLDELLKDFTDLLNEIERPKSTSEPATEFISQKKRLIDRIKQYSNSAFEISSGNAWMQICLSTLSFQEDPFVERNKQLSAKEQNFDLYISEAKG